VVETLGSGRRRWNVHYSSRVVPVEAFRGNGKLTSQDEELRRLQRELARVTEERDVLKKATGFFARESR